LKPCFALLAFTLAAAFVPPASAQAPSRTKVGMLGCTLSPSMGFIVGSQQSMTCQFTPDGPFPPETYLGVISTVGLDIGVTGGGAMAWAVFAPTEGPPRGGLAGVYAGATGEIGVGVGVGANVLFGGSGRTVALQPVSVEGQVGVNLAVGLSSLELRPAP
jgi:Protein of unknown function (DUF992)